MCARRDDITWNGRCNLPGRNGQLVLLSKGMLLISSGSLQVLNFSCIPEILFRTPGLLEHAVDHHQINEVPRYHHHQRGEKHHLPHFAPSSSSRCSSYDELLPRHQLHDLVSLTW